MKKIAMFIAAASMLAFVSCSSTSSASTSLIEKNSGKKVTAAASSFNFLGLSSLSQETADAVIGELQGQCNGGKVTSILTTVNHTWLFVGTREAVRVSGYCAE